MGKGDGSGRKAQTNTGPWPEGWRLLPNRINTMRHTLRLKVNKLTKFKDKQEILKKKGKNTNNTKGIHITLSVDFSAETVGQKGVAKYI